MKKVIIIAFLLMVISGISVAQDKIYSTEIASLQVQGQYNGNSLLGSTNRLGIILNYETTEIVLRLNLDDLKFDSDTLNKIVQESHSEIEFKGTLSLAHINTKDHPPLNFTLEGWVEINNEKKKIEGNGELHHTDQSGSFTCMIGIVMHLDLDDFDIQIPKLENEIKVVIKQALLKI